MSYNGWVNRTTWIAYAWLTNDEAMYQELRDIALSERLDWQKTRDLRRYIFEFTLGENSPISYAGLVADLVSDSLSDIDYVAIIESVER